MAKDRKKLLHIHSSVFDKQPTPDTLEVGELGVNNASGNTFISTKNSADEVVRFSEDDTIINWMEMKEVFPYEGYVRGSNSGVTGVTEADLLQNKSNIIVKINQVAARNSEYDEKINGAKDIYGNPINPISADGYRDGAGIAIDMSPYAMVGSNPSFSSVTTTCRAELNGTTIVKGTDGDCGSKFEVKVNDICIQAKDTLNTYGENTSNFGTSCDGNNISEMTTLKGNEVEIKGCEGISAKTDDFKLIECTDGEGSVSIDTTVTNINSCSGISANTNDFEVVECGNGGKVVIDTTIVNVSADTTEIKSCNDVKIDTDDFKVVKCGNDGSITFDTSVVNVSACTTINENTDALKVAECNNGQGSVVINTTNINVSGDSTEINSCGKFEVKSDDIKIGQCDNGNGNVEIKACSGITLQSDNLVLRDCNDGKMTITTNDLCLAGDRKVNLYGDETNVGLDCNCESGATIAKDTRVFGKAAIFTTKADCNARAASGNVEIYADVDIKEIADGNIVEIASGGNIDNTAKTNVNTVAVDGNITETASNGNINESATNINNTASKDICGQAASAATFYGAVSTNVGVNCDKTVTSTTTDVRGGSVIVDASVGRLGLTAKQDILESSEQDIIITANRNVCERASSSASFYGAEETKIGVSCDGDTTELLTIAGTNTCIEGDERATLYGADYSDLGINCANDTRSEFTRVSGDTVYVGGNIINVTADTNVNIDANNNVNITATNKLCEKAKEAYFYGSDRTEIGKGCDGVSSSTIVYWRNPEAVCDNEMRGLSSTTIDGALHEVYDRSLVTITSSGDTVGIDVPVDENSGTSIVRSGSTTYTIHQDSDGCNKTYPFVVDKTIVSMSAYTHGADTEVAKTYSLWQYIGANRVEIGKINIPKDHILKDVAIKHGHYDDATSAFTECEDYEPKSGCTYYIKMVWNIFDSGHTDDKTVYLPADDFIQDIDEDNSYSGRGVTVDVWYDGNKNRVSADTRLNFETPSDTNDFMYAKHDGQHWESGTTIIFNSGDVSGFTQAKYKPWSTSTEINIPTCVSHLNRHMITFNSGDVRSFSSQTYDPGQDCVNSAETINIPTSLKHLTEFNDSCYVLTNDICMGSNTIVANSFYNTSDISLKENINGIDEEVFDKVSSVDFKSFNFKVDDSKTKRYGVIAQDVKGVGLDEIVHKNDNGTLSVDYIQLLVLKIASLENEVKKLKEELGNNKK